MSRIGSEAAIEAGISEVVSMEDSIQALVDHLVYPLLPSRSSLLENPSLSNQEAVAKQMYAVVLLYNYYHRKVFPLLEYLSFESFCKMAVIAKPSLLPYMKIMSISSDKSDGPERQPSITEQMVVDACDVCVSLNSLTDNSSSQNWAIHKVAVLVVDSAKETCLLQFSPVTRGVWSLIEKDIESPDNMGCALTSNSEKMKKGGQQALYDGPLQQVAFSAVKEKTGIDHTDLLVLECHPVYSLSKARSMSQFYIMQFTGSFHEEPRQVPIRDVLSSLTGPMFVKSLGGYAVTAIVEYFHLLPYKCLVSDWHSRQMSPENVIVEPLKPDEVTSPTEALTNGKDDASNWISDPFSFKVSKNSDVILDGENVKAHSSINGSDSSIMGGLKKDDTALENSHNGICSSIENCAQKMNLSEEAANVTSDVMFNMHVEKGDPHAQQSLAVCNGSSRQSNNATARPCDAGTLYPCSQNLGDFTPQNSCRKPHQDLTELQNILQKKEYNLYQTAVLALKQKRDELTQQQRHLGDEIAQCEKYLQIITSSDGNSSLKFESVVEAYNIAFGKGISHSHASEASVLEDTSEKFPSQCFKRKKLSEAVLTFQGSCQELDEICSMNNWILPGYRVLPADRGFIANATVQGVDFEYAINGDVQSSPCQARQSAAGCMLRKLRAMAGEVQ